MRPDAVRARSELQSQLPENADYVCIVLIQGASRRLWGTAHARTRLALYSSADSEGTALAAGSTPNSIKAVRPPVA